MPSLIVSSTNCLLFHNLIYHLMYSFLFVVRVLLFSNYVGKDTSVLNTILLVCVCVCVCVCVLDLVSLRHYGVVGTVYLVHTTQESSLRLS